jgi:hypothetical protein
MPSRLQKPKSLNKSKGGRSLAYALLIASTSIVIQDIILKQSLNLKDIESFFTNL